MEMLDTFNGMASDSIKGFSNSTENLGTLEGMYKETMGKINSLYDDTAANLGLGSAISEGSPVILVGIAALAVGFGGGLVLGRKKKTAPVRRASDDNE